jgi:hypothetical protein
MLLLYPIAHVEVNGGALFGAVRETTQRLPVVRRVDLIVHLHAVVTRHFRGAHAALVARILVQALLFGVEFYRRVFHVDGARGRETHRPRGFQVARAEKRKLTSRVVGGRRNEAVKASR